ncbi:hypothetical protein CDAR_127571 [Caerostris darwini]|uniref:Uncharacterized protein n=1 Tax=Caerostris darwini TaxID=1538125 RepID=A0AAV4UUU5_9ARAC|nr:hypothetical protein CDAR_127571 [Caerostris darwini]
MNSFVADSRHIKKDNTKDNPLADTHQDTNIHWCGLLKLKDNEFHSILSSSDCRPRSTARRRCVFVSVAIGTSKSSIKLFALPASNTLSLFEKSSLLEGLNNSCALSGQRRRKAPLESNGFFSRTFF